MECEVGLGLTRPLFRLSDAGGGGGTLSFEGGMGTSLSELGLDCFGIAMALIQEEMSRGIG
jgi:hypothetical protein